MSSFRQLHLKLCHISREINDVYNLQLLMNLIVTVLTETVLFYWFYVYVQISEVYYSIAIGVEMTSTFLRCFIYITVCTSTVTEVVLILLIKN